MSKDFNLKIINLDDLKDKILNKPLNDDQTLPEPLTIAKLDAEPPLTIENIVFSLKTNADASVTCFNSAHDVDGDKIFSGATVTAVDQPVPAISYDGETAWLKYQALVKLSPSANLPVNAPFTLKSSAELNLDLTINDYHAHNATKLAHLALAEDVPSLRTALAWSDIRQLQPKEAISFQARGSLKAGLELKWADVISGHLGALSEVLKAGTTIGIVTNLSASAKVSISHEDDFRLVFSRAKNGDYRVTVSKAVSNNTSGSAELGIEIEHDSIVKSVDEFLQQWMKNHIGVNWNDLDALFGKAKGLLTPAELGYVDKALEFFGLGTIDEEWGKLKTKWEAKKTKVTDTLKEILDSKIKLSFTYEYTRIETHRILLQAIIAKNVIDDDNGLRDLHHNLLLAKFDYCTVEHPEALAKIESYLNEKSIKRAHAWGLSLGIGDKKIWGKDYAKCDFMQHKNVQGLLLLSLNGERGYDSETTIFDKEHSKWCGMFRADMNSFKQSPLAADFTYGFSLLYVVDETKLSDFELKSVVDAAMIWGIIAEHEAAEVLAESKNFVGSKPVSIRLELTSGALSPTQVQSMVKPALDGNYHAFASALGRAMPLAPNADYGDWHRKERDEYYASLWQLYFASGVNLSNQQSNLTVTEALSAADLESRLKRHNINMAKFESHHEPNGEVNQFSFAYFVQKNLRTYSRCITFFNGLKELYQALESGWSYDHLKDILSDLEPLCRNWHTLMALGVYLDGLCNQSVMWIPPLERSLSFRRDEGTDSGQELTVRGA